MDPQRPPEEAPDEPPAQSADLPQKLVEMNEALVCGAVRQHELLGAARQLNEQLEAEIRLRKETSRKLVEKARLLDLSNDAIIVRDLEDRILSWSKGAEKLYGWTEEEVLGLDLHHLLQTEFPQPKAEIIAQLHREGFFTGEVVQIARDGHRVPTLCRWVFDVETGAILTTYTDISERKRAEEALRESEERFRSLFDSAPMAVFVCGRNGRVQQFNQRAVELCGRVPAIGEKYQDALGLVFVAGRPLPPEESPVVEVLRTGVPVRNLEMFIQRANGSRIPVLANISPLRDGHGAVTGTISSLQDIVERYTLEAALIERAEDLARADRNKDEFLAMLAHELRNPLASLRNAAELLHSPDLSPDERAQSQAIIVRQIRNMTRMIDDLLDISRITQGKIELRKQVVVLQNVLTAATELARPAAESRRQEFALDLPSRPVHLHADTTRLEQVFGNLLGNASKYSPSGSRISLSAHLTAGHAGRPEVAVQVRDNGIGIAPELLPRIFELFVQATTTSDRAHGGLGIGLTLVHKLVKLHGGSVEARSEGLGRGSEFIVRLPVLPGPLPEPARPAAPQLLHEAPCRMLIVDDNQDSARSMAALQARHGHQIRIAFSGSDALVLAAEFKPEVVLLDVGLPGMDGLEVARRLRAMPSLTGAFLVAMTGYGSEADRAAGKEAGFDAYLIKPVDLNILREVLRSRTGPSPEK